MSEGDRKIRQRLHARLTALFPANPFVQRLVARAEAMGITFAPSPVEEQWFYHPDDRTLYVWEPDLDDQSLSYLVVILAHELGHAADFDNNPLHLHLTRGLHWSEVPLEIEIAAFVQGFRILKELGIPISLDQYECMIAPAIAPIVRNRLESYHLCCLLSPADRTAGPMSAPAAS